MPGANHKTKRVEFAVTGGRTFATEDHERCYQWALQALERGGRPEVVIPLLRQYYAQCARRYV